MHCVCVQCTQSCIKLIDALLGPKEKTSFVNVHKALNCIFFSLLFWLFCIFRHCAFFFGTYQTLIIDQIALWFLLTYYGVE